MNQDKVKQLSKASGAIFDHISENLQASETRTAALSAVVAAVLSFLVIFGSWRRWCSHWVIQKGVTVAYVLSFSLVTYTIGLMQAAAVKSEVYPIWAVCFLTVFGCTNSITACSLDDNRQGMRQYSQFFLYTAYVVIIVISVADGVTLLVVSMMLLVSLVKVYYRIGASILATTSWPSSRAISDYMESPSSDYGHRYLAPGYRANITPEDFEMITIDRVWQECDDKDWSLHPSDRLRYKDVCLSYSLYQLFKRRFFGYGFKEARLCNRNSVLQRLLFQDKDGCERAFKVIEVELDFLYDFFFTKYAALHDNPRGMTLWAIASVASMCSAVVTTVMRAAGTLPSASASASASSSAPTHVRVAGATIADTTITTLVLAVLSMLELLQLVFYWTSNWGRVDYVCQYIRELPSSRRSPGWSMTVKAFLSRITMFSRRNYWKHEIGQYSLLMAMDQPHPYYVRFARLLNAVLKRSRILGLKMKVFFAVPVVSTEPLQPPAKLTVDLKWSIIRILQRLQLTNGQLPINGFTTLEDNNVHVWYRPYWQERGGSLTPTILIWHIATCYCEMASHLERGPDAAEVAVATVLSRYCAYLVVHASDLLPWHGYDTQCLFDAVAHEAVHFLKKEGAVKADKCQAMRKLSDQLKQSQEGGSIFEAGVQLAIQLERLTAARRWKVFAEFWAEMMLYIAPLNNVNGHIEQLAKGGEFITHLWALLTHLGILHRDDYRQDGHIPGLDIV
uniref:DUF4220 domain-containing protein n=1 Tax=Oryza punctata TaxID=4537 RepID=A0A0E0KN24_ORYPU